MKLLSFAAAVCLAAFPVFSAFADDDDEPARTIPELTLEERIVDLLEAIQDNAPETYRRMSELPREEALARIMRALDSGAVPASSVPGRNPMETFGGPGRRAQMQESSVRQYPVFGLTDRMFPYLRFDALSPERVAASVQELGKVNGGKAPSGV